MFKALGVWLVLGGLARASTTVGGLSDADVILANETGLLIQQIFIDGRNYHELSLHGRMLVSVTPSHHHIKVVFRGGGNVDWPKLDFRGGHEIFFQRLGGKFEIRIE